MQWMANDSENLLHAVIFIGQVRLDKLEDKWLTQVELFLMGDRYTCIPIKVPITDFVDVSRL